MTALADQITETCCVQRGSRTYYTAGGQSGFLLNEVGVDVYWVGNYNNQRILGVLHNVSGNALCYSGVDLCQIEACLARLSGNACRYNDSLCVGTLLISALAYSYLAVECGAVGDIQRCALGSILVYVDDDDLAYLCFQHQGVTNGFSYLTCANYNDLVCCFLTHTFTSLFPLISATICPSLFCPEIYLIG